MKYLPLFLLFIWIVFGACEKAETKLPGNQSFFGSEYPILYVLEESVEWEYKFFEYLEPGLKEVPVEPSAGLYEWIDYVLEDEEAGAPETFFAMKEVEILSDSTCRVAFRFTDDLGANGSVEIDTFGISSYSIENKVFTLAIWPSWQFSTTADALGLCIKADTHTSSALAERSRYWSVHFQFCAYNDHSEHLDSILASPSGQLVTVSDTIALLYSELMYNKF